MPSLAIDVDHGRDDQQAGQNAEREQTEYPRRDAGLTCGFAGHQNEILSGHAHTLPIPGTYPLV